MPIFLVDGALRSDILAKIKSISPKNIYIAGGTVAVSPSIENSLKGVGKVVRLGGKDRYETSLKIAKHFNQDTTTAVIDNGLNFPDALTGSVLAAKNNSLTEDTQTTALVSYGLNFPDALVGGALANKTASPILLVNGDVTTQKVFLDKSNITKLYVLGSTSVVSDSIVKQLVK